MPQVQPCRPATMRTWSWRRSAAKLSARIAACGLRPRQSEYIATSQVHLDQCILPQFNVFGIRSATAHIGGRATLTRMKCCLSFCETMRLECGDGRDLELGREIYRMCANLTRRTATGTQRDPPRSLYPCLQAGLSAGRTTATTLLAGVAAPAEIASARMRQKMLHGSTCLNGRPATTTGVSESIVRGSAFMRLTNLSNVKYRSAYHVVTHEGPYKWIVFRPCASWLLCSTGAACRRLQPRSGCLCPL